MRTLGCLAYALLPPPTAAMMRRSVILGLVLFAVYAATGCTRSHQSPQDALQKNVAQLRSVIADTVRDEARRGQLLARAAELEATILAYSEDLQSCCFELHNSPARRTHHTGA